MKLLNNLRKKISHVQKLSPCDDRKVSTRVTFKNGFGISIQGYYESRFLYCNEGTFEIAPINTNGDLFNYDDPTLLKLGMCDSVEGYVDKHSLKKISRLISLL